MPENFDGYQGQSQGVATVTARFCRLRILSIFMRIMEFWAIILTKGGLPGKTLKCVSNVSVSYPRSPNDDYRG